VGDDILTGDLAVAFEGLRSAASLGVEEINITRNRSATLD